MNIITNKRRILVTGAAGRIGGYFARHHDRDKYDLRLFVRAEDPADKVEALRALGEVVVGDLGDLDSLKAACDGMDTVIHMAGNAKAGAVWRELLPTNIVGTYHVFAAAKYAQVKRVIYASSIHAVSGYPADVQVKTAEPVNPGDLYGVSKCFGEALCRYMAEQEGVSAIALRIGSFQSIEAARQEKSLWMTDSWVSERDLHQLITRCVDAPDTLRFAIFHGVSDNTFKRLDISDARQTVGYEPQDDLFRENPFLRDAPIREKNVAHSLVDQIVPSGLRDDL